MRSFFSFFATFFLLVASVGCGDTSSSTPYQSQPQSYSGSNSYSSRTSGALVYRPPIIPIEISIGPHGISFHATGAIVTPIGTFSLQLGTEISRQAAPYSIDRSQRTAAISHSPGSTYASTNSFSAAPASRFISVSEEEMIVAIRIGPDQVDLFKVSKRGEINVAAEGLTIIQVKYNYVLIDVRGATVLTIDANDEIEQQTSGNPYGRVQHTSLKTETPSHSRGSSNTQARQYKEPVENPWGYEEVRSKRAQRILDRSERRIANSKEERKAIRKEQRARKKVNKKANKQAKKKW